MKIISLEAENFKKLKAVQIKPKGNAVVISGKNEAGKTSVLDAIWAALGGRDKTIPKPIKDGEDHAKVTLDLGEYIVTRTWTSDSKSYLKVENAQGAVFKSPQELLDSLIDRLSFDPMRFLNASPKEQRETLLSFLGLELDQLNSERTTLYDERTLVGREAKEAKGYVDTLREQLPAEIPAEPVDTAELLSRVEVLQKQNSEIYNARQALISLKTDVENLEAQIKEMTTRLEFRKAEVAEYEPVAVQAPHDLEVLRGQINNAEKHNAVITKSESYRKAQSRLLELENKQAELTEKIQFIDGKKKIAIEQANMPISGLSVDDDQVLYCGIPLSQRGLSCQLKVAMSILMAKNPELKIILMNGDILDKDNLKAVEEIAKGKDYQVWIEKVDESGKLGIFIEEGEVKNESK